MKRIVTFLLLSLCLAMAIAQDEALQPELEETPEIRRYTVEIIVFSYLEDVSVGSEQFIPDEPPVEEELLLDEDGNPIVEFEELDDVVEVVDAEMNAEEEEPFVWVVSDVEEGTTDLATEHAEGEERAKLEFVPLTEEELVLSDAIRQFELLDAYETIMHVGWTQPTYPAEETPPMQLQLFGEVPDGLNGTFTLYLSRYLHLVVDLALDAPVEVVELADEDSFFSYRDAQRQYSGDFDAAAQPVRYRIQENRIVKNGELRYFDHPKFGVVAKITRVEKVEEEELDDSEATDPLLSSTGQ